MAIQFLPLAARAAASLAKNKKMRESLSKSVQEAFKKAPRLSKPSRKSVNNAVNIGTAGVAGAGAGVAATSEYNKKKKPKSAKSKFNKKMEAGQKKSNLQRKSKK
jgi:hypothetical protein